MAVANLLPNERENTPVTEKTFTVFKDGMFSYFRETLSLEKKETARLQRIYRETEESKLEAKTEAVSGTPKKIRERKRGGGLSSILKDALLIGGLTVLANNAEDLIKTFGSIAGSVKSLIDEIDKLPDLSELDDLLGLLAVLAGAGFLPDLGGRDKPKPKPNPKPKLKPKPNPKPNPKPKPKPKPTEVTPAELAAQKAGTARPAPQPEPTEVKPRMTPAEPGTARPAPQPEPKPGISPAQLAAEEASSGKPVRTDKSALAKKIRTVARNGKDIVKAFARELPGAALISTALEGYFGRQEIFDAAADKASENPNMTEEDFKKDILPKIEQTWIDGAKSVLGQTIGGAAGAAAGAALVPLPGAVLALGIAGGVAGDIITKLIPTKFIQTLLPDSLKEWMNNSIYDMMFNGDPSSFRSMMRELELKGNIIKRKLILNELQERRAEVAYPTTSRSQVDPEGQAQLSTQLAKSLDEQLKDIEAQISSSETLLKVHQETSKPVDYNELAKTELRKQGITIPSAKNVPSSIQKKIDEKAAEIRERTQKAIDASQGEVFINPPITTNAPPPNVTNTVIPGQQKPVQQQAQQQPSIETRNPDRTLDQSKNQTHFYNESGSSLAIAAP